MKDLKYLEVVIGILLIFTLISFLLISHLNARLTLFETFSTKETFSCSKYKIGSEYMALHEKINYEFIEVIDRCFTEKDK